MAMLIGTGAMKDAYIGDEKVKQIYVDDKIVYNSSIYLIEKGVLKVSFSATGMWYDSSDTSSLGSRIAPNNIETKNGYRFVHQPSSSSKRGSGIYRSDEISTQGMKKLHMHVKLNVGNSPCAMICGLYDVNKDSPYAKTHITSLGKYVEGVNAATTDFVRTYDISSYSKICFALAMRGFNDRTMKAYLYDVWMD